MSIPADPSDAWSVLLERGVALHRDGDLPAAEALYRRVLQLLPTQADAINLLGIIALQTRQIESALSLSRQAVSLEPHNASYHLGLGNALRADRQFECAAKEFSTAISLRPAYAEAHNNLGLALTDLQEHDAALKSFERAVALGPGSAMSCNNLASALRRAGRPADAEAACRAAIAADPAFAPAYNNLANILLDRDELDLAIAALHQSIRLDPAYADPRANLCLAEYRAGNYSAAIAAGRAAVRLAPDLAPAHWNLSHALLARGELAAGFAEYEWRTRLVPPFMPPPPTGIPRWTGEPLAGKTILLQAEQGLGDTIQFIRYAPVLADRGAKVILRCAAPLARLLGRVPGVTEVFAGPDICHGADGGPRTRCDDDEPPLFDYFCPLMSLPLRLGTTLETIPAAGPYILGNVDRSVVSHCDTLEVGLAWAGGPSYVNDRRRSMPLATLAPLATIPGLRLHSLQLGEASAQMRADAAPHVVDHSAELGDFADTADLIARLDLVIAVDTAVAHLAGAMGKPVGVLLPKICDWRWMLGRSDSPWYPTMRLFRQERAGDWSPVVDAVARFIAHRAFVAYPIPAGRQ